MAESVDGLQDGGILLLGSALQVSLEHPLTCWSTADEKKLQWEA